MHQMNWIYLVSLFFSPDRNVDNLDQGFSFFFFFSQSAVAVEYTDCTSAEG